MTTDMTVSGTLRRSQIIRVVIAVLVVSGATAFAIWFFFASPNTSKYDPVLKQLAADQLTIDPLGHIILAKDFPGLTPKNEMFFTRRADGSFLALFPTYYGDGVCLAGLMYTSRPLRENDTYKQPLSTVLDRQLVDVGRWTKLNVDKRLDDHWYMVSRGLH